MPITIIRDSDKKYPIRVVDLKAGELYETKEGDLVIGCKSIDHSYFAVGISNGQFYPLGTHHTFREVTATITYS